MNKKLRSITCLLYIIINFVSIGQTMENKLNYEKLNIIHNTNDIETIIKDIKKQFWQNRNKISSDADIMISDVCNIILNTSNIYLLPKIHSCLRMIVKQCIIDINEKFISHSSLSEMINTAVESRSIVQNSSKYDMDIFIDNCKEFISIINTIVELENKSLELVKDQIDNIVKLCKDDNNTKLKLTNLNILYEQLNNIITNITSQIKNNSQKIQEIIDNRKNNIININSLLEIVNNTTNILQKVDNTKFLDTNDTKILSSIENITENYFNTLLNDLEYRLNLHKQYHNENINYLEDNTNYNDGKIHVQYLQYKNLYNSIIKFIRKCNYNGDEVWENIPNFIQNELKQVLFNNYDNNKTISNDALNDIIDAVLLNIYHKPSIINPLNEIQKKIK